ncbi:MULTISPECIES: glycosyltransferase [Tessaracoccus]|uniref:glycosyltransferase n=1 Tax=Tessaracoccus TaxID=72763 RepID=UPI00099CA3B2|nr:MULTISPECIES: glycosyltransferase [Tessaracoccus]AQX16744.1 hypothetical protein BKM78_13130 [Tessaracoccus sp. T2.5-30]VEP41507.1 hypothetical protein TLA_TLA_02642 [Tessaracoccus lapidicaptus]
MRIMIISPLFDDLSRIGSIRPRAFATWLARAGHDVTVITQSLEGQQGAADPPGVSVIRIMRPEAMRLPFKAAKHFYDRTKSAREQIGGTQNGSSPVRKPFGDTALRIFSTVSRAFRALDDRAWVARAAHEVELLPPPDAIFSTYGPLASHWLAMRLAKGWSSASWVADFRDLVTAETPTFLSASLERLQTEFVVHASVVTAISKGLCSDLRSMLPPSDRGKVNLLPNGFDPRDTFMPATIQDSGKVLRIAYTGNLYMGRRDASPMFRALGELLANGHMEAECIEVHYAGMDSELFLLQARAFGVEHIVVDHGFVSRDAALALQAMSDVLLVLSWNTISERGILTGKVFEYLGADKPILALTGGDLPGSELTELINDLDAGFAFEEATHSRSESGLRTFLLKAYEQRSRGEMLWSSSSDRIRDYTYEVLSRRLESLLLSVQPRL